MPSQPQMTVMTQTKEIYFSHICVISIICGL